MFGIPPRHPHVLPETLPPRDPHSATVDFFAHRGVGLTPISSSGWLIRATSSSAGGLSVLGCVQEHGDAFELMELEGGFRWSTHGSLHLAVAHLLTDARVRARIDGTPSSHDADDWERGPRSEVPDA
jgi:hypothetical protein